MKKYFIIGGASILLFVVTAIGSYFWQQRLESGEHPPVPTTGSKSAHEPTKESETKGPQRAAVRPPYSPESEQLTSLSADVQKQLAFIKRREAELEEEAKRLDLVKEDLRGERAALDELRKQVNKEMEELRKQLAALDGERNNLHKDAAKTNKELESAQKQLLSIQKDEEPNLKKISDWWGSMDPSSVAQLIQKMSDSGKMDMAVKILALMQPRQAAPVIAALTEVDSLLAAQLMEKIRVLRSIPAETTPKTSRTNPPR